MSTAERSASRRGSRAGFTLVEMLVALVISGLLTTVIFQALHGNSRFVANQMAREEVQQNTRAALDLIAADVRAAAAGGIVTWEANRIRLRVPRGWGISCNAVGTGNTNVWAIFPDGVFPPDFVLDAPHWGIALNQTNDPSVTATGANSYRFVTSVAAASAAKTCPAVQPQMAGLQARGFRTQGPALANAGLTVPAGAPLMVFEEVEYDVAAGTGGMQWVRRSAGFPSGVANMQPMAGPVPNGQALRFTYLTETGAIATTPAAIRQVRVRLVTQSRARTSRNGTMVPERTDSAAVDVFLRN